MEFMIKSNTTEVRFWSSSRLPFQPKGAVKKARDELRLALEALPPTGHLHAEFITADPSFCDPENVLLYNVGMPAFAGLASSSLSIVRTTRAPDASPSGQYLPYSHVYRTGRSPFRSHGRKVLLERKFRMPHEITVASVWMAARSVATDDLLISPFNLALHVETAFHDPNRPRLHSLLKPLLDGIVSSLHRHDGTHIDTVVSRIARSISSSEENVERALMTGPSPLACRPLVHPFMSGVQWNPADEIFNEVVVTRSTHHEATCRFQLVELDAPNSGAAA